MCAVIGVKLKNPSDEDLLLIRRIFLESQIRGMHATGMSFVKDNKIHTVIEKFPAKTFCSIWLGNASEMRHLLVDKDKEKNIVSLIGHCRYSTSDIEYNQPITSENVSIVHNGVITQELPENWKKLYGYDAVTKNDSELLLQTSKMEENPFDKWPDASIAAIELYNTGKMRFYRNGKRPLYLTPRSNGFILTSTRDIMARAEPESASKQIKPGKIHQIDSSLFGVALSGERKVKDLQNV